MGKSSFRFFHFLLGLRWTAFILGVSFSRVPSLIAHDNFLANFLLKEWFFSLALFAFFEGILSSLQRKTKESVGIAVTVVSADIIFGAFLAYLFGVSFFLLAALVPIAEAFLLFDSGGALVAVFDFLLVAPLTLQNFFVIQQKQEAAVFLLGQLLFGSLVFWLLAVTKRNESEIGQWKIKEEEEGKKLRAELQQAQSQLENLYRQHFAVQKQLDEVKAASESSLAEQQMQMEEEVKAARRREETAGRESGDLLQEMERGKEERESLNFLVETSSRIYASLHLEETFVAIVETLGQVIDSQTCLIFLVEQEGNKKILYPEVASTPYADYFRNYVVDFGEGVVGWVAREKETALIENGYRLTADGFEFKTLLENEKSAVVAPLLKNDGNLLGVLYLGQVESKAYSWEDVNVLLRFLPHIQTAIANAREYHDAVARGILDPVTGLPNRIYFEERLSEEIKRSYRYQFSLSLLFLKIDRFDNFQETLEEASLRNILKAAGELFRGYLRDADVLSVADPGKFGIILVQTDLSNAVLIAERIRLAVEMREFRDSRKERIPLTVSIGVGGYPRDGEYKADLLAKCEGGLKEAMTGGGNKTSHAA